MQSVRIHKAMLRCIAIEIAKRGGVNQCRLHLARDPPSPQHCLVTIEVAKRG